MGEPHDLLDRARRYRGLTSSTVRGNPDPIDAFVGETRPPPAHRGRINAAPAGARPVTARIATHPRVSRTRTADHVQHPSPSPSPSPFGSSRPFHLVTGFSRPLRASAVLFVASLIAARPFPSRSYDSIHPQQHRIHCPGRMGAPAAERRGPPPLIRSLRWRRRRAAGRDRSACRSTPTTPGLVGQ
jgi:hypothetical protein